MFEIRLLFKISILWEKQFDFSYENKNHHRANTAEDSLKN